LTPILGIRAHISRPQRKEQEISALKKKRNNGNVRDKETAVKTSPAIEKKVEEGFFHATPMIQGTGSCPV